MIFVNYGGGGYWFFDHSRWNGKSIPLSFNLSSLLLLSPLCIMGISVISKSTDLGRENIQLS